MSQQFVLTQFMVIRTIQWSVSNLAFGIVNELKCVHRTLLVDRSTFVVKSTLKLTYKSQWSCTHTHTQSPSHELKRQSQSIDVPALPPRPQHVRLTLYIAG